MIAAGPRVGSRYLEPDLIRVLVVEDHELIREGIKKVVRSARDIRIVGETDSLDGALHFLERNQVDVVSLDITLPDCNGLDGLLRLRASYPRTPVLMLSMHTEERFALRALQAGAAGYITKAMAAEEVVRAVRMIGSGSRFIGARVGELLADAIAVDSSPRAVDVLSPREKEIVRLLAAGLQVKQIAARLDVSVSSVNTYRMRIFRKTGLKSNSGLIRFALLNGLDSEVDG